ncbi:MAG: GntR family transcriptional regulator [Anaerolineales bacterium]|nr:GntR family transcriptional regulator [Anaerolineales bacterium]
MNINKVDTQKAYQLLWEKITSLELAPGEILDFASLADEMGFSKTAIREALNLLVHDHLVEAPPRGLFVSGLQFSDLEKISTIRLNLETLAAQQAVLNATTDDLVILQSLCKEVAGDTREYFELDQRFHQAIAKAAHNNYLADTLQLLYGLSKRLWFLALPYLDFLPTAVKSHIKLVDAIRDGNESLAAEIMKNHIEEFYLKIREIIQEKDLIKE